jgi:hypothetical protein
VVGGNCQQPQVQTGRATPVARAGLQNSRFMQGL